MLGTESSEPEHLWLPEGNSAVVGVGISSVVVDRNVEWRSEEASGRADVIRYGTLDGPVVVLTKLARAPWAWVLGSEGKSRVYVADYSRVSRYESGSTMSYYRRAEADSAMSTEAANIEREVRMIMDSQ